ncbi:uncharacterized protein B0H64DRAFT_372582 [Chaetomium fimeti]|uniref:Ubiquitination network signaling protein n=1 Tax=Chaetomium fimeti TaxID=1854472 RepID=A0AAE0HKB1_9PEZI|nr:hypothetical protein B0H64DRAFT_372582 [Chaetomium fimeti]
MPRASNSAKRHQAASNQRDTRHENGLVGPGKRVIKRKSQTQLDDGPRLAVDSASVPPVPPLPTTLNGFATHLDDMAPEHRATELLRRGSLGTYSESSSTDSLPAPSTHDVSEGTHRRIDVNDAKNTNVHRDPGPLDLAITVLRSCPLADTIAILIILMQASPAVLATIYMLFTVLTFVPPVTTSSGLSFTEIFDGSQGIPSLWTLIWMDVIMLLIWLFLWAPVQQFILDLAQVVISYTLGGGGTSRQGTTPGIVLCVGIVGVTHWIQKWNGLSRFTTIFGSSRLLTSDAEPSLRMFDKKGPYGWVRSVLAIHILTQGIVRCIREWYLRRERRDLQSQGLLDPESGKSVPFPGEGCSDVALMAADSDAHLQTSAAHLTSKKRRKQSAQVRIKQPLWAALASTKIVMVKEYELSHAASESAGSNATDIHNLGNAPFHTQPEQVWICYVGCDEVCFNTSHFPDVEDVEDDEAPQERKLGIDASKPFYVRVNKAIWQPTRIIPIENPEEENYEGTRWTGDIYGLTPLSNYECEFISTRTGEVLFSTSIRTVPAKSKDPEAPPTNKPRSHSRHDSPATTLRASIAAAEVKLADEKARLKAVRKDNNRKLNATRKEIEKLTSAVQSAGGDDEKLRQKIAQNKIQEKRAEESTCELEVQLKELEAVPEKLVKEHRAKHDEWTSEKTKFDKARASFKSFKSSIDKQIKSLDEEKASLQAKRNKIAARIAKVDDEHARITDANARGLNEAERRRQERANLAAELARAEQNLRDRVQALRLNNATKQAQVHAMAAHMQEYLASFQKEPTYEMGPQPNHFSSAGPWATIPAPQFNAPQQPVWPPVSMPMSTQATPLMAHAQLSLSTFSTPMQAALSTPPQPHRMRGRSSSMLSDVSGFTQSTDEDEHASGSGSGSGGSGSLNNASTVVGAPIGHHHHHHHHHHHRGGGLLGGSSSSGGGGAYAAAPAGTIARPPPGFHVKSGSAFGSGSSGSGSGFGSGSGRSSVRSGSGSGASLGEAVSPV